VRSSNLRWFVLSQALGYSVLSLLHLRHSLPALEQGRLFIDLDYGGDANRGIAILQFLTLGYLFAIYALTLQYWSRLNLTVRGVSWTAAAIGVLAWSALPANSTDLFTYVAFGRIAGVYGANPYLHRYAEFADSFSPYAAGSPSVPMPYGPVTLPLFMAAGVLSLRSVIGAIYALKFIWLLIHGANCWLIYNLLKSHRPNAALYGLFLFGFNPLLLLELVGNGHNDGLMILFVLGSLDAAQRKRSAVAVWLALVAALVKSPALVVWGAILVYLVRRREWRTVIQGVLGAAIVVLTLRWLLLSTPESQLALVDYVPFSNTSSVHHVLIAFVAWLSRVGQWPVAEADLLAMDRRIFSALFFCFGVWRLTRVRDLESLVREVGVVWIGLMIGYAAMSYPWYVTWLVPLAALTESGALRRVITVYSFTVLSLYAFPAVVARGATQWMWATFRIGIAHILPLGFALRGRPDTH